MSKIDKYMRSVILILYLITPGVKCPVAGHFFWKPRLGIDLSVSTTTQAPAYKPSRFNIEQGKVVMINAYSMGMTMVAIADGLTREVELRHLQFTSAFLYTNAYRWMRRYLSLFAITEPSCASPSRTWSLNIYFSFSVGDWLGGHAGHFGQTNRVYYRRGYFMDSWLPNWTHFLVPFVNDWDEEQREYNLFKKYSTSFSNDLDGVDSSQEG